MCNSLPGWCSVCGVTTVSVENLVGHDTWFCNNCDDFCPGVRPLVVGGLLHRAHLRVLDYVWSWVYDIQHRLWLRRLGV